MHRASRWGLVPRPLDRRPPLAWPAHLLIVGPGGLGDTIVALPVLRRVRHAAPQTKVSWIAPSAFRPLLEMAGIDGFIASDQLPPVPQDFADVGAMLTFQDAGPSAYSQLGTLASIPLRISSAHGLRQQSWCNHLVHMKRLGWPRHEAERNFRLLIPFGIDPDPPLHELTRLAAITPHGRATPADLPTTGYVVLHAFSAGHAREWPIAHWIALTGLLTARGWSVVLTGSASEAQRLAAVWPREARSASVHDAFGRLDLGQLSGLLSRAAAVVAASTGPLHLAAALGVPSLGLFVPRKGLDLSRWAPLGARAQGVQARTRCARRCDAQSCSCIGELTPLAVADAVASATLHEAGMARVPVTLTRAS